MEKYKRYYGVMIFGAIILVSTLIAYKMIAPNFIKINDLNSQLKKQEKLFEKKKKELQIVKNKIKKIQTSISSSQKKIFSPLESDLGNDSLFFTLYNDLIEMVHSNSVKIKSIKYEYNPVSDAFVEFGKQVYFVCDVDMELVSNYVNLGKLIQDIYQYPYYIKINDLVVKPYSKDKKILLSALSIRMYAHTEPKYKD